jgi:hypothetical protein
VMRLLNWVGVIDMSRSQKMRYTPATELAPPSQA